MGIQFHNTESKLFTNFNIVHIDAQGTKLHIDIRNQDSKLLLTSIKSYAFEIHPRLTLPLVPSSTAEPTDCHLHMNLNRRNTSIGQTIMYVRTNTRNKAVFAETQIDTECLKSWIHKGTKLWNSRVKNQISSISRTQDRSTWLINDFVIVSLACGTISSDLMINILLMTPRTVTFWWKLFLRNI